MNNVEIARACERVGLRWEDGPLGRTFVYGPVENPKYVRLYKPMFGNPLIVSGEKHRCEFDILAHPDLREAVVESVETQRPSEWTKIVRTVYVDPLRPKDWRAVMREAFMDPVAPPEPTHKLNTDRTVAVATDYYWNEDMRTCPLGVKVQLLGVGGVASYGNYNGRDPFWVAWAPLPKRRTA